MQEGILFDNVYVGHSEADAKAFRQETWAAKFKLEDAKEKAANPSGDKKEDGEKGPWYTEVIDNVYAFRNRLVNFLLHVQNDPVEAVKKDNVAAATIGGLAIWVLWSFLSVIYFYLAPASRPVSSSKKTDAVTTDDGADTNAAPVPKANKESGAVKRAVKKADD
jgi:hypothetical protein